MAVVWRDVVGVTGRGRLEPAEILFQVGDIVTVVQRLQIVGDGLKVDAGLGEQRLIFAQAVDEVPLVRLLLPTPGRLRRHDAAFDLGLDAIGTWLLLIAAHFSLLAENAGVATRQFHHRRLGHGDPRR